MVVTEAERMTVAQFISQRIDDSAKSQREIAAEVGFENPNVLTMFKQGQTKVPLRRIGALARALDVDPTHLLRLVMSEYTPDTWAAVEDVLGGTMLTKNERELITFYRRISKDTDPPTVIFGGIVALLTTKEAANECNIKLQNDSR